MSTLAQVIMSLMYTATLIGCLWWAHHATREVIASQRFSLSSSARLLVILAVAGLIYVPASNIVGGIVALMRVQDGWYKAAQVLGSLAVLGFVGWIYMRITLD